MSDDKLKRRIEILKLLQGKEMRTGEIAEYFGVQERTIRSDIQSLRDGMDILGTKIKIESKHDGNQKQYYKSTVHPIILALNSSELFALLKLLESAALENRGDVYNHIFNVVYSQITDYAVKLIADKLQKKHSKTDIVNQLEEEAFEKYKDYKLVYWEKSGRFIKISYLSEEGLLVDEEVKLIDIQGNKILVQDNHGNERLISYDEVVIDWSSVDYK
ncbi:MAG: HTH domain-containing protein [Caldicoprobacterales bacterium]